MRLKETKPYTKLRKTYYALKNWDTTKDNLRIKHCLNKYKNIHKGQACVIVGNGPSLRADDLSRIYHLGIPTFACNRVHLIFPQTEWRPTYYFISDEKIIKEYSDNVEGVPATHRFFPKRYRDRIKNGVFYNELPFDYERESKFSKNVAEGLYPAGSVTTEMLQFAYFMGFAEIYLIGVDFNYQVTKTNENQTYEYQGETNYFIKDYLKPGEVADMPNMQANLLSFLAARRTAEENGRIIKNATRGGKLEIFERVDLDVMLQKWGGGSKMKKD